jgi:Mn2+/Fe2+ NRAMP family transporter
LVYIVLLVNVIAVLARPPALLFLYMLVNDREIMGELVSPPWANVLALAVVVILIAAGLLFGVSVITPNALAMIGK